MLDQQTELWVKNVFEEASRSHVKFLFKDWSEHMESLKILLCGHPIAGLKHGKGTQPHDHLLVRFNSAISQSRKICAGLLGDRNVSQIQLQIWKLKH